jgi:tetratricopeptide (TPR) repeat protein
MPPPDQAVLLSHARDCGERGAWPEVRAMLSAHPSESRLHPELILLFGEALLRTQSPREASEWLAETRATVRRSGDRAAVRRVVNLEGVACFETGELARAEERFQEAIELGRQDGDDLLLARAMNNLGAIANVRGAVKDALSFYRAAIAPYQRLGHARGLAETIHNLAISFRDLGDAMHAEECERRAMEYARQAAAPGLAAMARVGLAELQFRGGDAAVAEAEARRAAAEMARAGDAKGEADAMRLVGVAATSLGRHDEAARALDRAVTLAHARGFAVIEAEALRARAELEHARGDDVAARATAADAMAIFRQIGAARAQGSLRDWLDALPDRPR